MNLHSLESSIQNLLSVLYPPFEATGPTLLSQLFQIIDSHFQGDALRCLLDFLVPAKHILDTVQQAACAWYSDVLFLCEGWPLCLRDQVVIQIAPIHPFLLKPGDFYLRVAPFCDQSARIVVCSLLEEEGLLAEVVEETPILETSYPCIFSHDWLEELNQGRRGTSLSQCLLTTEQGVVRLPWERVYVPDLVDVPVCAGSSMASAPPPCPSLPPLLPHSPALPHFPENTSSSHSFALSPSKECPHKQYPLTSLAPSPHPSTAYSVETRICPAKHGIAVSLCLVDARTASSSRLVKLKETDSELKPVGLVAPNQWDHCVTGTDTAIKTNTVSGIYTPEHKVEDKGVIVSENIERRQISGPADHTVAEGDYIDILQATMLIGRAQSEGEEQKLEMQQQSHIQPGLQMPRYPHRPAQLQPHIQMESEWQSNTQTSSHTQLRVLPIKPPNMSSEVGPPSALHHSQSQQAQSDPLASSQCGRTIRFSENPCTPCMRRRQGGKVSAQELRCRYRDSYQAALKNPVTFRQEREGGNMLAVVKEDSDVTQCEDNLPDTETKCNVQEMWVDSGMQQQSVSGAICKESGEKNTVSFWKPGDTNAAPCVDYNGTNVLKSDRPPELKYGNFHNMNETTSSSRMRPNTIKDMFCLNDPQQHLVISDKHHRLPFPRAMSALQNKWDSDGRCSSLSTAVVDTSEKCELVLVEGPNIRRRENADSCAEIPQLHVVKCKRSTAFRLVSPKVNRRTTILPVPETQRICQPASAQPRPDHLPLGSPDPRAHPLYLGVASVTGGRDRTGRAIVELYGDHQGWTSAVTSQELFMMLLYFYSITRREIRQAGLTFIFDAKKTVPQPQVYKALIALQEQFAQAINSVILLVDKENSLRPERCPGIKTGVVTSMKALSRLVEVSQLSSRLGGTLSHSRCDWMELHQKLFPFVSDLHDVSGLLIRAIHKLKDPQRTDTVQIVHQCMMDQRTLMKDVLEDSRLVRLQREGGAILARLRKESDLKYPHCEEFSDAVESVTSLYNLMEEQAHVLVQRSNVSLEHLEYLQQLKELEGHIMQMQHWFNVEAEHRLLEAESVENSGDGTEQILNSFTGFLIEANDRRHHAMTLVSEAERLQQRGLSYPETDAFRSLVCTFKSGLEDFLCRAEACGRELQVMVNVCNFCEQATALASECNEYLNQSQSRINLYSVQDHGQVTPEPTKSHKQESGLRTPSLSPSDPCTVRNSGPNTQSVVLPGTDRTILQDFIDRFLQFSPERFQEMKAQATALQNSRGMLVWNIAWLRCQEARQQLQERMQIRHEVFQQQPDSGSWSDQHYVDVGPANVQTPPPGGQCLRVQSTPGPRHPNWEDIVSGQVDLGKRTPVLESNVTSSTTTACSNITVKPEDDSDAGPKQGSKVTLMTPPRSTKTTEREMRRRQVSRARSERDAAALSQSHTVGCQWFPWGRGLRVRSVSQESYTTAVTAECSSAPLEQRPPSPSSCSHHGQPSCRILQEAQKFQISRHGSFCSEGSGRSEQGAAGGKETFCCKHSSLPIEGYERGFCLASPHNSASNALRLQRVLEELVVTEREYVRSLGYILTHYLPLLDRQDIPQDLRGKRGIIFGNLEKLYDFHSHYFLPELEACQREPAMAARCFLRHSESFGLYALYSKNKPQSDTLILHRQHDIFKRKQQELGDMMDLSSYLLRPIQRISKYNLLLQDILALAGSYRQQDMIQDPVLASSLCGPSAYVPDLASSEREREKAEIQAAADLVRFQMRHGNDLLTMDAIRDCDVNLKEQGQLIRQDEFTVFFRKKKCVRRVFLFEDLILFSKTKKTDNGNDVYIYKQSFKTCDIGMTHNSSVSSLCFEIWFRRRKSEDTYTLRASSMDVKKTWTTDLEKILWDQATHSRELRMQERVFMGMGRKPFMDIQHSSAAICDRAVTCIPPGRIPVACCSYRGLECPRPHSTGSGSTASTTLSQSSSSSGRGSLPPAGYPGAQSQGAETSLGVCSSPEAVTENERNIFHQQHLHRNYEQWEVHRHLLDSTDSSAEGINLFGSSDHSYLSAIGGEVLDDSSSLVSQSSKQQPLLCRTPSLRSNSSSVINKKKPDVAPKPPHLPHVQHDNIIIGRSTEV